MPPIDYTPITKMYEQQSILQRDAATRAAADQKKAMLDAQNNAAQQAQSQANFAAQQALGQQAAAQIAKDAAAKDTQTKMTTGMGTAIAGSGYDAEKMKEGMQAAQPFVLPAIQGLLEQQNATPKERKLLNALSM